VRYEAGSEEQHIPLGMLIRKGGSSSSDLKTSRGRSYAELLERYRAQQRDAAVASGKDYCKTSGRHTVHAGGVTFIAGGSSKDDKGEKRRRDGEDSDEEEAARERKKKADQDREQQAKQAAIREKYLGGAKSQARAGNRDGAEGPERMRLG